MQEFSTGAGLSAIGFWLFIAAVIGFGVWDGIRKRDAKHETLRRVAESGRDLDVKTIDKIMGEDKNKNAVRDLRVAGLITLFVTPGLALFGWIMSLMSEEVLYPMLGASAIVGCVTIGLFVAARYLERVEREDSAGRSDSMV